MIVPLQSSSPSTGAETASFLADDDHDDEDEEGHAPSYRRNLPPSPPSITIVWTSCCRFVDVDDGILYAAASGAICWQCQQARNIDR